MQRFIILLIPLIYSVAYFNTHYLSYSRSYDPISVQDTSRQDTIAIDTIDIAKPLSPLEIYNSKKNSNRGIYLWGDKKDIAKPRDHGGVSFSIHQIFSRISKIGRRSRRLQRVFDNELNKDLTNQLWEPLILEFTDLTGDSLFIFQTHFQPDYHWLANPATSRYDKVDYILRSLRNYRDSAKIIHKYYTLPIDSASLDR